MKPPAVLALIAITAAVSGTAAFGAALTARAVDSHQNGSDAKHDISKAPGYVWSPTPTEQKIDSSMFIPASSFESAWAETAATGTPEEGRIVAGIVNHHALAADLIADFFHRLAANRPDATRLFILSPDHAATERPGATIIGSPYQTPDGNITIDGEMIDRLSSTRLFTKDDGTTASREHGIGLLMPFIRRAYSDKIRVIPLVISQKATDGGIRAFADALAPLWDDRTIIILSADLSHGLTNNTSESRDAETADWLARLDATGTRSATDRNLDSGTNATVLFSMMRMKGIAPTFSVFAHRNSTMYGGDPANVTSYMTGVWSVE